MALGFGEGEILVLSITASLHRRPLALLLIYVSASMFPIWFNLSLRKCRCVIFK